GAWGIGKSEWIGAEDEESLRALHRAIDLGVTFIDTALAYGDGHSERLVGQVVRARTETVSVATKVPPMNHEWPARPGVPVEEVFPGEYIRRCAEQSLRNLGLETIDLLQLHVWNDEWVGQGDWLEAIERLKEQGKIRFFGVSVNDRSEEHTSELQSRENLVCRLLLEKKKYNCIINKNKRPQLQSSWIGNIKTK